ncbi:MAG: hypothetical protein GY895_22800, partial [Phycisphaera sp.]|nr:hypothetical protein [Phycisphaera sp.]
YFFGDPSGGWNDIEGDGVGPYLVEWSADCNGDGVVDYGQILDGTFTDCDGNGVPDLCDSDGNVIVFGENSHGELDVPVDLGACVDAAAGGDFVVVATIAGDVRGWGRSDEGATSPPSGLPTTFEVSAGSGHALAIDVHGQVHAWGRNGDGQCDVPNDLGDCIAVAGGRFHSMALLATGEVRCWGGDLYGQSTVPELGSAVVAIAAGDYHSMAVLESGEVVAWGRNGDGQCDVPAGLSNVIAVSGGSFHSLALLGDGSVAAWGRNSSGQCDVPAGLAAATIDAGFSCSIALAATGEFTAWGDLSSGKGTPGVEVEAGLLVETVGTHTVLLFGGSSSTDSDGDGIADCVDPCPEWPHDCSEDGQTITVAPGQSIAAAVEAIPNGGRVSILPGTYFETVDVDGKSITVVGSGGAGSVVIDGEGVRRGVVVARGETAATRFENLVFRNCVNLADVDIDGDGAINWWDSQGAGGHVHESSPTFASCRFESNVCGESGGGIYIYGSSSSPEFIDCVFKGNVSAYSGGGVSSYLGSPTFVDCDLEENRSDSGNLGGGGLAVTGNTSFVSFFGGRFAGNETTVGPGGAVFVGPGSILFISGIEAVENTSAGQMALHAASGSEFSLAGSQVCDNLGGQVSSGVVDAGGNCVSDRCDSDADGTLDCDDSCPEDPDKTEPGTCGCGVADGDADGDGTPDCLDGCPDDPDKTETGACGCGVADTDTDGDGTPDCLDSCPSDSDKTAPGVCGCGVADTDTDGDGIADCNDACPNWPYDCSDDAQTIFVEVGQSIQEAIDAVPEGGTVRLAAGTYDEAVDFGSKNLVLEGDASDPSSVVLDGTGATDTIVKIIGGQTSATLVRGLTIRNGTSGMLLPAQQVYVGGGMMIRNSDPRLEDVVFVANRSQFGGGLYLLGSESVVDGCVFLSNVADEDGGGVFIQNASAEINAGFFDGNTAANQGGAAKVVIGESVLSNCVMTSNVANEGGGIYWFANMDTTPLRLESLSVTGNTATASGGGIKTRAGNPGVDLENATVCGNSPDQLSGVYIDSGETCISEVCDSDSDGTRDCYDNCPDDPNKTEPGACGCGVADTDTDGDGTPDCLDSCPSDPNKTEPGACGCGVADTDTDGDGTPDCLDSCPADPNKTEPGACGCG